MLEMNRKNKKDILILTIFIIIILTKIMFS